jgi:hypothetical protein
MAVLTSEYAAFSATDSDSIDADVLFSISWRNVFYPADSIETFRSHIFAVAPNQDTAETAPYHWGYDMGTVTLTYQDGDIDLNKIETKNGGIFYELGKRRPGGHGHHGHGRHGHREKDSNGSDIDTTSIPYYPRATYQFSNSGTDTIPAITIEATAPDELLAITSHLKGDSIDTSVDLLLTWNGGESSQPVIVAIKPGFHKEDRGSKDGHKGGKRGDKHGKPADGGDGYSHNGDPDKSFGDGKLKHHMFDEYALRYYLDSNSGTFTIPAADIQELLSEVEVSALAIEVKQLVTTENEANDLTYRVQFRLGDMIPVNVK